MSQQTQNCRADVITNKLCLFAQIKNRYSNIEIYRIQNCHMSLCLYQIATLMILRNNQNVHFTFNIDLITSKRTPNGLTDIFKNNRVYKAKEPRHTYKTKYERFHSNKSLECHCYLECGCSQSLPAPHGEIANPAA